MPAARRVEVRVSGRRAERRPVPSGCVFESDDEVPGTLPGFIGDLMTRGRMERNTHQMLADFKALAEAKVPAHA